MVRITAVALLSLACAAELPGSMAVEADLVSPPVGVKITYLANEGFLLVSGEQKVLIDALFPGITHYSAVPEPTRSRLESAKPPFDGVDLVLATHFHDDHFGAREVARHLAASGAVFLSTPQVAELLRPKLTGRAANIWAHFPEEGERTTVSHAGIDVTILNLHHGRDRNPPVENLGFLLELGGLRILHIGDTEVSKNDIRPYRLNEAQIDVALVPSWFLAEPQWQGVVEEIQPARVVAMHLATAKAPRSWFGSAGSRARRVEGIRVAFPSVWIPTEPLETRRFSSSAHRMPAPNRGRIP
ncbi:MAG: MBL fold metallo-hydrolase [Acidobacteriota bacterium]|nr:MBL fold metallo-hydrolase [Acidobacteriota bacterium]